MATHLRNWYHRQDAKLAYRRSCTYHQQTNYSKAIAALNRALLHHPAPAEVHVLRGMSYWRKGELDSAYEDFTQAIELDPTCAKAYGNRGLLLQQAGDEIGALADWETALHHCPTYAEGYYHRALVRVKQDNVEAALEDFNRAITLRPDWPQAYSHRGDLKQTMGDIEGAIDDWQLAVCNDLSLEETRAKLQAANRGETAPDYVLRLQEFFADKQLTAQIQIRGRELKIRLHREVGVGVNYFALHKQLRTCLIPLELSDVTKFSVTGYVGQSRQTEWSQTYDLYKDQPCPPSHWQSVLSTLLMFPPCGVTALIYAVQVQEFYKRGKYSDALRASKNVKKLCLAGAGLLCFLAVMPLGYTAFASLKDEAEPPQRTARSIDHSPEQQTLIE